MLRRDYGLGALEALVTFFEHAQPHGSEHARGDSLMLTLILDQSTKQAEMQKRFLHTTLVHEGGSQKYVQGLTRSIIGPEQHSLQDIVSYLFAHGFTESEVLQAWYEMLEMRFRNNFLTPNIFEFMNGVMINGSDLKVFKEIQPVCQLMIVREFKNVLVDGCFDSGPVPKRSTEEFMKMLHTLLFCTIHDWQRGELATIVKGHLIHCLARGAVGTAQHILIRFGYYMGLFSGNLTDSEVTLMKFMPAAMVTAENVLKQYGVACALAEHLGKAKEADRLREKARTAQQRVALNYMFYHAGEK